MLGIALAIRRAPGRPYTLSLFAGLALALSAGFWIAFVWAIPAVIFAAPILFGFSRRNLLRSTATLASFAGVVCLMFGAAILILDLRSLEQIVDWKIYSSHGIETSGISRVVYGLPQTFAYMGKGGAQFKRFLLSDPDYHFSVWNLVNLTFVNLLIFYLSGICALRLLTASVFRGRFIVFLAFSILPLAAFAATFDGAAVERYLPVVPGVFLALGLAMSVKHYWPLKLLLACSITLLVPINLFILTNAPHVWISEKVLMRSEILSSITTDGDQVFTAVWTDPLINFTRSFPFHDLNFNGNRKYLSLLTPGTSQTRKWKEEFAFRALQAWDNDQRVFVSVSAFRENPEAEWNWVEGFDRHVRWRDVPAFSEHLDVNCLLDQGGEWVMINDNGVNRSFLTPFAREYYGALHD